MLLQKSLLEGHFDLKISSDGRSFFGREVCTAHTQLLDTEEKLYFTDFKGLVQ